MTASAPQTIARPRYSVSSNGPMALTIQSYRMADTSAAVLPTRSAHQAQGSPRRKALTAMAVANVLTILMDGAVIVLALLLTRPWGRGVPAWLLAVPMWAATGLLAPVMAGYPLQMLVRAFGGSASGGDGEPFLHAWVFAVVYTGFIVQGLALGALFVLYARDRWGRLWRGRMWDLPARPETGQRALAVAAATGVASEVLVVRRLRQAPVVISVIATLGLGQFLAILASVVNTSGGAGNTFPQPPGFPDFAIGALRVTPAYSAMLLVTPSFPWYYAWLLPFVAFRPRASQLYLCAAVVLAYLWWWLPAMNGIPGPQIWILGPALILFGVEAWRDGGFRGVPVGWTRPARVAADERAGG